MQNANWELRWRMEWRRGINRHFSILNLQFAILILPSSSIESISRTGTYEHDQLEQFLLPVAGRDRLLVRRGRGRQRQHRAHGDLLDCVAGCGRGFVLPGGRRVPRRGPTDGLRRRHDGAVGVRRDAHGARTVRFDENRRRPMDHGDRRRRGSAGRSAPGRLQHSRLVGSRPCAGRLRPTAGASDDAASPTEQSGLG